MALETNGSGLLNMLTPNPVKKPYKIAEILSKSRLLIMIAISRTLFPKHNEYKKVFTTEF